MKRAVQKGKGAGDLKHDQSGVPGPITASAGFKNKMIGFPLTPVFLGVSLGLMDL